MTGAGKEPLRFVFGVHQHQPVGNFGYVFEEHTRDVYLPLLKALAELLNAHQQGRESPEDWVVTKAICAVAGAA